MCGFLWHFIFEKEITGVLKDKKEVGTLCWLAGWEGESLIGGIQTHHYSNSTALCVVVVLLCDLYYCYCVTFIVIV